MGQSFEDAGNYTIPKGGREKDPPWDAKIKWFQLPDDDNPYAYRLVARPFFFYNHWMQTRKKDGTEGKSFPILCKNFDPEKNVMVQNGCKVCAYLKQVYELAEKEKIDKKTFPSNIKRLNRGLNMASNAIIRELQSQGAPSNNAGDWTFIHAVRFPGGTADTISDKAKKYQPKGEDGNPVGFNHAAHGRDLNISYNANAKDKAKMYSIDLGDKTPLTKEEMAHAPHLVNFVEHVKYMEDGEIEQALQRNGFYDFLENLTTGANLKQVGRQAETAPESQAKPEDNIPDFRVPSETATAAAQKVTSAAAPVQEPKKEEPTPEPKKVEAEIVQEVPAKAVPVAPPKVAQAAPVTMQTEGVTTTRVQAQVPNTAATPKSEGVKSKIEAFSKATGIGLAVHEKAYPDMRFYQPGMAVPICFTKYSAADKTICKQCSLRLDCMMADEG